MNETKPTFKILTIDGGGIKGMLPASFVSAIETETGKSVVDYFDLIVGTSTGGIIALALGLGIPGREIADFYEECGPKIFRGETGMLEKLRSVFRPKFESADLREALEEVFEDRKLGESKTRLVVPATDAASSDVHIYKTAHHPRFSTDYRRKAVEAAMATSAAPSFFSQYYTKDGTRLLDGGLWANNPIMVAIVEAVSVLGRDLEDVKVLSLGNVVSPLALDRKVGDKAGMLGWLRVFEWFLSAQSKAVLNQSRLLLGDEDVLRVEYNAPGGVYSLDDAEAAKDLRGIGSSLARKFRPKVEAMFLDTPAEPFQPYHSLETETKD